MSQKYLPHINWIYYFVSRCVKYRKKSPRILRINNESFDHNIRPSFKIWYRIPRSLKSSTLYHALTHALDVKRANGWRWADTINLVTRYNVKDIDRDEFEENALLPYNAIVLFKERCG